MNTHSAITNGHPDEESLGGGCPKFGRGVGGLRAAQVIGMRDAPRLGFVGRGECDATRRHPSRAVGLGRAGASSVGDGG
jgi:hypothetical protein